MLNRSPNRPTSTRLVAALFLGAAMLCAASSPMTLHQAIKSPKRTAKLVARDSARHPQAELRFFGIKPTSHVIEVWPGGGYWTEILAPYLHDDGEYTAALGWKQGNRIEAEFASPPPMLQAAPADRKPQYDRAKLGVLAAGHSELGKPGTADFVLTFRNLHNWVETGTAPQILAEIHTALKPGGILGIEDHRARPDQPQDPKAADGYLRQDYTVQLVEKAGFKLVGSSELLANPRDTTHHPKGVWTLPPTYAMGDTDRAKYKAIGEADNFLLKFKRVD